MIGVLGRGLWSLLFNKWTWFLIGAATLVAIGHDIGKREKQVEVDKLRGELAFERVVVAAHLKTVENMQDAHQLAIKDLKDGQVRVLNEISIQLAEAHRLKVKTQTKEVIKYVSAKADVACTVPRGFVRLHDEAAGHPAAPAEALAVSRGGPAHADAPSGVALSAVAGAVRDNYAEAVERGEVIRAWQDWYVKIKALWEKAAKQQGEFQIVAPPIK